MNYSCKVNSKGQITIPSQIRKLLSIQEDDVLLAEKTDEGAIVLKGGKSVNFDKDTNSLLRVLEETFSVMKKREKITEAQ
ncbi:AbrB/MazE/SpoVT family DNA-binding domain-containing protein [Pelosinus propionicus]|uniref:Looped-hinge helix DNA binding domain-containing protein, AbrB family n=1 Tax=Pelosinus propionicus DSM 13327 TaxID=1123291 RepID=A0A1I4HD47_9FIRM|nr:AbrB/MazE/SpoVT family DNA-binding domain-containing protein [Pelosinus propionicus]SFL39381.1 looped-hinge helix DNA binding domain-containing protein, AbrB family [Pelosinus propionicus DSM 13327]